MADAMQSFRHDVHQEAADKLVCCQRHGRVVAPQKGFLKSDECYSARGTFNQEPRDERHLQRT